jgi:DNA-binding response OmpR family regulator
MKQKVLPRVRFGAFELDAKAGELHYQDKTILLQDQSFRLLLALIERDALVAASPALGVSGSTTSADSIRFVRKRIRPSIWRSRRLPY